MPHVNAPRVRIFPSTFNSEACSSALVLLDAAFCSVCMQVLTLFLLPQLCSQNSLQESRTALSSGSLVFIYLSAPPQAVSGKGRAHASIASLMHIWLPYHEAGSKLQWALMFSRKWAETSLNQCGFFFFQWNSRIHCSVSSVVWVLQIGCLNTAVGNTALWSLTFFFLFNLRKDSGRIEEHI